MSPSLPPYPNGGRPARRRPSVNAGLSAQIPPTYTGGNPGSSNQGQYPTPRTGFGGTPPPPGADRVLWGWFMSVDTDGSGSIHVDELQKALVNGNWSSFDLDTCKMLLNIFDVRKTGSLAFPKFCGMWTYIQEWQNVFRHFDTDSSGSIEGEELANALARFGYGLSPYLLSLVEKKYATIPLKPILPTPIWPPIDCRFVRACVVIKTLTDTFQSLDVDHNGRVSLNYDQFLQLDSLISLKKHRHRPVTKAIAYENDEDTDDTSHSRVILSARPECLPFPVLFMHCNLCNLWAGSMYAFSYFLLQGLRSTLEDYTMDN
ncbi:hypothetical protein BS47DRAFT_1332284 [Hydnum rufescens UP504]|uniref:EF-hand domain-containing protein n=1 Tax=Hydnum rufescens UP504 TaxID=1448309 RepID=A0A9P6DSC5_9AGAM|nr:hypothetical protein BS47DRAFT_1332284 [Hydnum rufescens UP504]